MKHNRIMIVIFVPFLFGLLIGYVMRYQQIHADINCFGSEAIQSNSVRKCQPSVHIVDLNGPTDSDFKCIKPKTLLNYINTHICLHKYDNDIYVSSAFRSSGSIWEEEGVTRILQLLLRHPNLDFVDIGANIGTYTMYVASLGRFVMGIDCFEPNIKRIQRAVQLADVANRVVLIQNALFKISGETLRLSPNTNNIGGQNLQVSSNETGTNKKMNSDPYLVKTIRFDDLLPIFEHRGVRGILIKMDIEGSESFVLEGGSEIFNRLEIPFILMEWMNVKTFPERVKLIFEFFNQRSYDPRTYGCQILNQNQYESWPADICWVKRNTSNFC